MRVEEYIGPMSESPGPERLYVSPETTQPNVSSLTPSSSTSHVIPSLRREDAMHDTLWMIDARPCTRVSDFAPLQRRRFRYTISNTKEHQVDVTVTNSSLRSSDRGIVRHRDTCERDKQNIRVIKRHKDSSSVCVICLDAVVDTVLPCDHMFCGRCLKQWAQSCHDGIRRPNCGFCRKDFDMQQLRSVRTETYVISGLSTCSCGLPTE